MCVIEPNQQILRSTLRPTEPYPTTTLGILGRVGEGALVTISSFPLRWLQDTLPINLTPRSY